MPNYDLPNCKLMQALAEKASQREDIIFDVLGRMHEFRQKVAGEVRQINKLFPEYTPHDEQYHLKRLFYVADTVLGEKNIKAMNLGELFVLSIALYGHDWGMAVNDIEKDYIIYDRIPDDIKPEELWILSDEKNRFNIFAHDQQLFDKDGKLKNISVEIWREYVRQTHAFRSGERIRRFFEPIDGSVADATSRVCIGHWLDFESLQDHDSFPANFSVMRDVVNLRALAVYLRLIDMLDLAEDRTPYVIWKFVAPRNPRSKMEWLKHRALRTITCPPYLEGRVIRVDGSTDDHNVYAALEDLRIWCEKQLRGCNDVLARMNDPKHKLDIYHIDWHIETRRFKKTSIGFQFDREQMFEILGSEIYQGDQYVFLRELLQNSIDAIRMRREILRNYAKIEPSNLGIISVNVKYDKNSVVIIWSDDGIGMDEYIIENYLAVAGKSYYRSQDYEKIGLTMDPISRFGVGILSCFIVADSIEIETYKDPNLVPASKPMRITIPDQSKRFRIEILPDSSLKIGTTIRVFIDKNNFYKNGNFQCMKFTEYLSTIAGFVEFPIIVDEDNKKTIIIHPKEKDKLTKQKFGDNYRIQQLNLSYPWSEAFKPQDLANAREFLRDVSLDINSDLGFIDFEGVIACPVPRSKEMQIENFGGISVRKDNDKVIKSEIREKLIRKEDHFRDIKSELSNSSKCYNNYSIYKDGVLVPLDNDFLREFENSYYSALPEYIRINLSKKKAPLLDLSRNSFYKKEKNWFSPIHLKYKEKIGELYTKELISQDPFERLYMMGWIASHYKLISIKDLWDIFPNDHWPVAFLKSGGELNVLEFKDIKRKQIDAFPYSFNNAIDSGELLDFLSLKLNKYKYKNYLIKWGGNDVILAPSLSFFEIGMSMGYSATSAAQAAFDISIFPFEKFYFSSLIKFNRPPWIGNPPLFQSELSPYENLGQDVDNTQLLDKAINCPKSLGAFELHRLSKYIYHSINNFSKPYDSLFGYGMHLMNINHPVSRELIKIFCSIEKNVCV